MDPYALSDAINADRATGCVPVMIAATAGTTNAGMIDPLPACDEIARTFGLWYHVDAAWGGALIASERLRHALQRYRERRLGDDRRAQVVRNDHGLRDVPDEACVATVVDLPGFDQLYAVEPGPP